MSELPLPPPDGPPPSSPRSRVRPRGRMQLLAGLAALGVLLMLPPAVGLLVLASALAWRVGRRMAGRLQPAHDRAEGEAATIIGISPSGRAVLIPDQALAAHGLILGASGSGKTTTMLTILTAQIARGRPVIAIDLKGSPSFAEELRRAAADAGASFRLWTPDGGCHWNPLAIGNATELKDKLIATERFTEPHYQRAAERYLQTAIRVLQESEPIRPVTLARVVEMLEPNRLAAALRPLAPSRGDRVRDYLASLGPDQLSAIRGLATRLAVLSESHTGAYLEPAGLGGGVVAAMSAAAAAAVGSDAPELERGPHDGATLDLRRALNGGATGEVVVFSLNSSTYGHLAAQLGTLAVQDLVTAAGARLTHSAGGTEPLPALVAIDEFSALGSDNVLALLARGRESGVGVLLATQELADLDRAARGLRDQVLGNTAVKIAHRQDVPESAETIARLAGSIRTWERSYQEELGHQVGLIRRGPSRANLRLVDRYAIEPDRIRTLAPGEAAVMVKTPRSTTALARVTRRLSPLPRSPAGRERA